MTRAIRRLADSTHPGFPVTIYYAFKQSESKGDTGPASTGWETFLDAVIGSGFAITGTWPIRTEQPKGLRAFDQNALASSIVLVCRRRPEDAPTATRREFLTALRTELPQALRLLQTGNVAPVDLAQAAIGPGMGVYTRVYTRYATVLDVARNRDRCATARGDQRQSRGSRRRRCSLRFNCCGFRRGGRPALGVGLDSRWARAGAPAAVLRRVRPRTTPCCGSPG